MITDIRDLEKVFSTDESAYINIDCMELMKQLPDKSIELAIVDPVYGDVSQGGYMGETELGKVVGNAKAKRKVYHQAIWQQSKTPPIFQGVVQSIEKSSYLGR